MQQLDQRHTIEKGVEVFSEEKLQRTSTMAAKFLAKSFVFNLSKAFPPGPPLRRELSRVCFFSVSKQPLDPSHEQDKRDSRADFPYQDKDWRKEVGYNGREAKNRAGEAFEETMDKTRDQAEGVKEKAKEGASQAAETGESAKERAKDYANDTMEKTKEMGSSMAYKAEDTKDKVKEGAYNVKEKTEDAAGLMADKTKETAETMTEKAKKTVKEAWGAAKEKSQQVKESVMVSDKEDGREKAMDEDVVELRRTAGKEDD